MIYKILRKITCNEFFGDLNGWIKDEDTLAFITNLRDDILKKF